MNQLLKDIDANWLTLLNNDKLPVIYNKIKSDKLTPKLDLVFSFARLTELSNIKVVIIGQDPYYSPGEAHGLAFSSLTSVPKSLEK